MDGKTITKITRKIMLRSALLVMMVTVVVGVGGPVYAQIGTDTGSRLNALGNQLVQPAGGGSHGLEALVNTLLEIAVPLGVFAVFLLMGQTAFLMMTSQGNPEKLKEAKEVATNAIIGFLLVALGSTILVLINNVFNLGITP